MLHWKEGATFYIQHSSWCAVHFGERVKKEEEEEDEEEELEKGGRNLNSAIPTTQGHSHFLVMNQLLFGLIPLSYVTV